MSEDKKFASSYELIDWLKSQGVDEEKATTAADKLYHEGYDMPSTLLGASTPDEFVEINISRPIARHLSNKLSLQQQNASSSSLSSSQAGFRNLLREYGGYKEWKVDVETHPFAMQFRPTP